MRSKALTRTPKFKPTRDRMVSILAVACPSCGAGVNEKCVRLDGTPGSEGMRHPKRRQLAVRADNLSRGI